MSWITRTYQRDDDRRTRYAATDARPRFPMPAELTVTPPFAGGIRADYVLSPWGERAVITGLRRHGHAPGGYVGNLSLAGGKRRLVVALLLPVGDPRELHVAVASGHPKFWRKPADRGLARLWAAVNGRSS